MNQTPLLVTCGLPYTNGPCHLGHLRTYVPADAYVRYLRRAGEEVVFVCGSDNHGTPIVVSAEEAGTTPRALSEKYHKHFDETFKRMGVVFDRFGMTDDPANHHRTQDIVSRLQENGYIYKQVVHQAYCTKCKRFLPDRYVEGICPHCGKPARGDECDQGCGKHLEPGEIKDPVCKVCGTKAEFRDQEHFFFKLSEFKDFLLPHLDQLRGTTNAKNYAIGWIKDELHDWCITRTLDWGVKFPGRDDLVVYVWVDAPIGYIAFTEEWAKANGKDWKRYWCGDNRVTHFIGGDIIYHHSIFWPALLKGAGYGVPHAVVASGMVKVDDHKFSKSRGYVVWTNDDYLDKGLPVDYLRYYLLSYTSHTKELNFAWPLFAERINNEVVNIFGNFVYRTLFFAQKEFEGVPGGTVDPAIMAEIEKTLANVDQLMRDYEFKGAVDSVMGLAAFGNTYIQTNAPWKLVKTDKTAAAQVIKNACQIVKALALLIQPVMPDAAERCWKELGFYDEVAKHPVSDALHPVPEACLKPPTPLFVKMEEALVKELDSVLQKRVADANKKAEKIPVVTFEEFQKLDLRTGKVLSAEPVPKSNKLLKLMVDIGSEKRQIVAGMQQFYKPEEIVGKDVVVVTNLAPAKIFGVESNGMVLAAGDAASLLVPLKPVEPGTKIR
ncbi:methionine--tRNA ligase [Methanoregula sp.]|uniref:methionine--tRNA ligase n=1 Tax=Methanoregula sp. TaxID=2052170 RepID=UPI002632426F|nr:methionine--tRNA ligase [Methanoregula sp.]MDD5142908.1 methionine--tRNA ligase [Methanoregula sp.]